MAVERGSVSSVRFPVLTIDSATGLATRIGNTGDRFAGLAFDTDGNLFGVTADQAATPSTLFALDLTDATPTFVLSFGDGLDGEAIAFNPEDGLLYHYSGFGENNVFESVSLSAQTIDIIDRLFPTDYGEVTALTRLRGDTLLLGDLFQGVFKVTTDLTAVTFVGTLDHVSNGFAFAGKVMGSN